MSGALLVALLVALAVFMVFVGVSRTMLRRGDAVEERLQEYGVDWRTPVATDETVVQRPGARLGNLLAGFGMGRRLADALTVADLPLTAAEFTMLMLGAGVAGFLLGTLWRGIVAGLLLGALGVAVPLIYLRIARNRRRQAITAQLPEVLTLLVGALRAGHGIAQAIEMLVEQLPPPASREFARVARAMALGVPLPRALDDMARRVDTDDVALVVTAITVQYEMGGNLAQTLETIGQTVRDRISMLRQVRVLTAHQRLTGYVLTAWPIFLGVMFYLQNPARMARMFQPDMIWLPVMAGVMQLIGFLVIRRIVDIEV